MKLQIASNKTESIDNGKLTIQDKVNKIMGIESNEMKGNKMKLQIASNKTESSKPKKLELKTSKGINQESLDLNIDKFAKVESILNKLDSIDSTFTEFLKNQNEAISVINAFTKRIDTFELIQSNMIKNQKSILDSINALHANLFQNHKESKEVKKESKEVKKESKVILRKKESNSFDSIDSIFNEFQNHFNHNNFMGNKELTSESRIIFQNLLESIDDSSLDSIQKGINDFRSKLTKESGKYMTARKSNKNFDSAIIKTIEALKGNSFDITESKQESEPIDKNYFANLFKVNKEIISDLIQEAIDYGKVDNALMESIQNYFNNPSITDNMIGQFANYIKAYMEAIKD